MWHDFGFWITLRVAAEESMDFGFIRLQGLPTLDDQFWFCSSRFAVGVFPQKFLSKIYNPEFKIGSQ
ncbi:MAG: hypothetical protein KME28_00160 [Pelatocladus maniniholoensis HA4357-MV3]|jgi:hypothetical protein|uniref:Uncharacterized protein n=1 Tax=Pelatocladus maniniholoensis HA4357-MV3 TaxID=1117104 RepID=A0A9E3H280_9NOST|nr:hypothetical protein [Pelatocladus maniniholoensis HA4357-MV3]BAZ67935.1 hypothetical protein NIES4106_26920 [Fischerella sp. NIES-4106]